MYRAYREEKARMIGIRREIFFGFGKLVVKGLISGLDLKGSLSGLGHKRGTFCQIENGRADRQKKFFA